MYSRFIEMCVWAHGTIYGWRPEMDLYLSSISSYYTSTESAAEPTDAWEPAWEPISKPSVIACLETSLRAYSEALLHSQPGSLLERVTLREVSSFPQEAFGRWKTLSLWKLWLIEDSRSVEALVTRKHYVCGSFDANVDIANLLV